MIDQLTYIQKKGAEIESVVDDLAQLRITVFHDYPYLYEGTLAYEKIYLKTYIQAEQSFLFAVYDGSKMVGATTCIPLKDETSEVQKPLEDAGFDVNAIFYFGESILLPQYRGLGLGHRFFDERENHVRNMGNYTLCCFCSVNRGDDHPLKPVNYRPNDAFWIKRGYKKEATLQSMMEWPDLGETEPTLKRMIFWIKSI
ncbi:GNAT family N-acetyltransferase [Dyadobacter pollutisoli]|jgi:hypothetical protein|uniref:GNAT family N-acetyltransferase n=1 Tax=Dyadobacter pollutisoli TaxID=2910158 RepID=A0A9E8SN80_9BACT|nr:GNAT family N-acetyltransferase [Dyadobacter pollutisoli]WAC10502.1 GNAT family N-acetyltransferase [Dyadobacter pollutisoli]